MIRNLFMDGFDQYARSEDPPANLLRMAGYTVNGVPVVSTGRTLYDTDSKSLALTRASFSREYYWSSDILSVGIAFNFDDRGGLLRLTMVGGADINVWTDRATGLVNCQGLHGYVMPVKKRWYYLELEVNRLTGNVDVYINGKLDISVPAGFDLTNIELLRVVVHPYGIPPNSADPSVEDTATKFFDDLYINSDTRITPAQVTTRFPTSSVQSDWDSTVDGEPNWQVAAGTPVEPLDRFLYTAEDGATEQYYSSKPVFQTDIVAVGMVSLVRKATPDPLILVQFVGADEAETASIATLYSYKFATLDGSSYNAASIAGTPFGFRLKIEG